ncbi:purine-cytosine permease family protein [Methylobacterium oryzae CBMB20]
MSGPQRIIPIRRDYNRFVADETLEDYALRFTAKKARRWSSLEVAQTALGSISFLALEAIGGTLALTAGFPNTVAAVLVVGLIIFATAAPITVYAARYGVDMDLLTRGAGFGYLGSTVTSLIYASFTFLFFAIEAAIMALALQLCFGLPLGIGYLLCAGAVIPLVVYGIRLISRFQIWTQPVWIGLSLLPLVFVAAQGAGPLRALARFPGLDGGGAGFDLARFGLATGVLLALLAQVGEQVDFLRFVPEPEGPRDRRWWLAVLAGGAGWILPGMLKILLGAALAVLALGHGVPAEHAAEPTRMYAVAFGYLTGREPGGPAAHRPVRPRVAAQDQPDQRLCRLDRVVELLLAPDPQPSGAGGLARVQRRHRGAPDGARHRQDHREHAAALRFRGLGLGRGARRGSRRQQAAGALAAGHRVQARPSLRGEPGRHRRHGAGPRGRGAAYRLAGSARPCSPSRRC